MKVENLNGIAHFIAQNNLPRQHIFFISKEEFDSDVRIIFREWNGVATYEIVSSNGNPSVLGSVTLFGITFYFVDINMEVYGK